MAQSRGAVGVSQAQILGPEDESKDIAVTVWLKPHNKPALDELVQQMYDKKSANYHHWLTMEQYKTQFAPTAKDVAVVRELLASHDLQVTSVDKYNHYVAAHGRVGDAQTAFHVQMNRVMTNGVVRRVSASQFSVNGPAANIISAVQGLNDLRYRTNVSRPRDPETGVPYDGVSPFGARPDGHFFSGACLRLPETVTFSSEGTRGDFPKAIYQGNGYGSSLNSTVPNLPPCGYDSTEIQTAYGLNNLYKSGLDGTNQTIVIVDPYGSNTLLADANLFSYINGLPPLTSSNFQVYTPTGAATCTSTNGCIDGDWQLETTTDVEWAHAIAPNANIALVLGASTYDLDIANLFAIENQLGSVLSNSFGAPEIALLAYAPEELIVENGLAEIAAALGISQNVSSGDFGDSLAFDTSQVGISLKSVGGNAASPFVTAVGGTSLFLNSNSQIELQTGWGTNLATISKATPHPPVIPPLFLGFQGGSGGGVSVVFPKPGFQQGRTTPGVSFRQVPDISMNADPFTGAEIIVTPDSVPGHEQFVIVAGGTSLACPMFSAFWAIANQAAEAQGLAVPLGQAAPILYDLPQDAITDVNLTPASAVHNVVGVIEEPPAPRKFLSADLLAQPEPPTTQFLSALFEDSVTTYWNIVTFGTDSSLSTNPGWDDVTGLGTPNGQTFINRVLEAVQQ